MGVCKSSLTCPRSYHRIAPHSYDYDLPILAMDIVIANGGVTLAVADACPLSPNLSLPSHYLQTMHELQVRAPPSWDDGLWVG